MKRPYAGSKLSALEYLIAAGQSPKQIIKIGTHTIDPERIVSNSASYKAGTSSSSSFAPGGCIISSFSCTVEDRDHSYSDVDLSYGTEITVKVRYTDADDTEYDVPIGTFYITDHKLTNYSLYFEAFDAFELMDQSTITLTYPLTALAIINQAIEPTGVVLKDSSFSGFDTTIDSSDTTKMTRRQAIQYAAQICGKYAWINSENELCIGWYDWDSTIGDIDDYFSSDVSKTVKYTGCKVLIPGEDEEDVEITGEKGYVYVLSSNPFITANNRDIITGLIKTAMVGHIYSPGRVSAVSNPLQEPGDVVNGPEVRGTSHLFPITSINYRGTMTEDYECGTAPDYKVSDKRRSAAQVDAEAEAVRVADDKIAEAGMKHIFVYKSAFDPYAAYDTNTIVIVLEDSSIT